MNPSAASDAAAALQGASLAFRNKKQPAPPAGTPSRPRSDGKGALTAAAQSASRCRSPIKRLDAQWTGGSAPVNGQSPAEHAHHAGLRVASSNTGGRRGRAQAGIDPNNPSVIAATLAASRNPSPGPPAGTRTLRRQPSGGGSSGGGSDAVDSLSIAPTTSLISMFEKAGDGGSAKRASPRRTAVASPREGPGEHRQAPVRLAGLGGTKQPPATTPTSPGASTRGSSRAPAEPRHTTLAPEISFAPAVSPEARPMPKPAKPAALQAPPKLPGPRTGASARGSPPKIRSMMQSPPSRPPASAARDGAAGDAPGTRGPGSDTQCSSRRPSSSQEPESARPNPKSLPLSPTPSMVRTSTAQVLSPKPTRPATAKPVLNVVQPSPKNEEAPAPRKPPTRKRPPTPPQPRGKPKQPPQATSTRLVRAAHPANPEASAHSRPRRPDTASSDDSFVSASSHPSPEDEVPPSVAHRREPLGGRRSSLASAPTSPLHGTPRPYGHAASNNSSSTNLGLNNLTSAIVAGSLASSRLTPQHTGSSLPPPPLPHRQRSPRLRGTMRDATAADPDDDEDDHHRRRHHHHHHGRKHKLRRGKHKHHEGSRRKWRDQITARERKRYEAVWASNRGRLLPATLPPPSPAPQPAASGTADLVANIIVRDIWRRSRLPEDELAEVWSLVDSRGKGVLGRHEFVVGMWLIDQRLKGRKIPQKVSDSVWGSASGLVTAGRQKHAH